MEYVLVITCLQGQNSLNRICMEWALLISDHTYQLHKHLKSSNLSVVDSDCQLVAAPGDGSVGELICGGGLAHYCGLED